MEALIQDNLVRNSDVDVRVAVASCMSEIIRITASDAAYDNEQMRASILGTVSKGLSSWSHIFINGKYNDLGFGRKQRISVEMLKPLLATIKKHNELGEEIRKKSVEKLKPYLMPSLTALDSYTEIVTRVCEGTTATTKRNDENASWLITIIYQELFQGRTKGVDVEKDLQAKSLKDFEEAISMVSCGFNTLEEFHVSFGTRDVVSNVNIPLLFIQPKIYKVIKNHPSALEIYQKKLLETGQTKKEDIDRIQNKVTSILNDEFLASKDYVTSKRDWLS
ncbi:2-oxoglutarate dehydrogenase, mitochondrial-like protein [Tanacetum coccineum]